MKSAPRTGPVHGGAGENADGQSILSYLILHIKNHLCRLFLGKNGRDSRGQVASTPSL
jgi:hypothetical protein